MTDIVTPPAIDALPPAPLPTDAPEAFNSKSFATLAAQEDMVTQVNASNAATHQNAVAADERAVAADASAVAAGLSAAAAELDADRLAALDALWLGSAATDPLTGREGAPLVAGNAYVNTGTGLLRAYNGAAWVNGFNVTAGVDSVNGSAGAIALKTVGGVALLGAGDVAIDTAPAVAVGALDIDCSAGVYFTKTIAGNSAFTFSNPPASGTAYAFMLELTHTSGTVSWPAAVRWPDNIAPTLTTSRTHLFVFTTDDAGARWRAAVNPNYTT